MSVESTITSLPLHQHVNFDSTLVQLYDSQNLLLLAKDNSPAARADLLENMTSFFDLPLQTSEKELASDILLSLLRQAETDLRRALAERLSSSGEVPLRVVLALVNDEITVAETVLKNSPVLNELDLMYIIQSHSADYWAAIAARRDLTDILVGALANKRDVATASVLLKNDNISLQKQALEIFADMAKSAHELNVPLIHRPELPSELAQSIYGEIGDEYRRELQIRFPDVPFSSVIDNALNDINKVIANATVENSFLKPELVRSVSGGLPITPARMIEALRLGQLTYFKAMFAEYTGLRVCMVDILLKQKGGRGIAIACKAKKMERPDFMTLFMLKSAMANVKKIVDHNELAQAVSTFDKLENAYATSMLKKAVTSQGEIILA